MTGRTDTSMERVESQPDIRTYSVGWLVATFFAGAISWSVFHLVGYLWATIACSVPERLLIGATALLASGVTVGAMWHEQRAWRGLSRNGSGSDAERTVKSTDRFIALSGLYLNAFFIASILLTALSVFFLRVCE